MFTQRPRGDCNNDFAQNYSLGECSNDCAKINLHKISTVFTQKAKRVLGDGNNNYAQNYSLGECSNDD
jgi:hypothetical protein